MLPLRLSPPLAGLIAIGAGGVSALGFAPWDLWPLTLVGIAVLFALVDTAAGPARAALVGWLFGTGHFIVGLTWIATAFTFQAKMPAELGWVAVVLLSMFLALYVALAAGLARSLVGGPLPRLLVLAAAWMLAEWLRGWVLTGFAWNPLGAAWLAVPGVRQLAQFGGVLGLSGLLVLAGGALWLLGKPGLAGAERLAGVGIVVGIVLSGIAGTGLNRSHYHPDSPTVFLVQPNIGQSARHAAGAEEAHLAAYLDLTRSALAAARPTVDLLGEPGVATAAVEAAPGAPILPPVPGQPIGVAPGASGSVEPTPAGTFTGRRPSDTRGALIVWSESAVPYAVEEEPSVRARLAAVLGPDDLLLFGGLSAVRDAGGGVTALTNSLFVIDARGRIRGRYDKAHLVPLGEYVPAREVMTAIGLARLTPGTLEFQRGPGPRTLTLPGFPPVGVQICYEIIFPGAVVDAAARPAWIANISNDAWFGPSGPPQHLALARLRALEEGLPIVRATPTGISAIIDGHGNVGSVIPLGTAGVTSAPLPPPLPPTLFARIGHMASLGFGALLLGLGLAGERWGRQRRPEPASGGVAVR